MAIPRPNLFFALVSFGNRTRTPPAGVFFCTGADARVFDRRRIAAGLRRALTLRGAVERPVAPPGFLKSFRFVAIHHLLTRLLLSTLLHNSIIHACRCVNRNSPADADPRMQKKRGVHREYRRRPARHALRRIGLIPPRNHFASAAYNSYYEAGLRSTTPSRDHAPFRLPHSCARPFDQSR